MKPVICYFVNMLIILDKVINVIFAPLLNLIPNIKYKFGNHRDTLSEVFGRNKHHCKACKVICKLLGWIDRKHCEESIED